MVPLVWRAVLHHLRKLLLHVGVGRLPLHDPSFPKGRARRDAPGFDLGRRHGDNLALPLSGGRLWRPGLAVCERGRRSRCSCAGVHRCLGTSRRGRCERGCGGPGLRLRGVDQDGLLVGVQLSVMRGVLRHPIVVGCADLPLRSCSGGGKTHLRASLKAEADCGRCSFSGLSRDLGVSSGRTKRHPRERFQLNCRPC